jgi:hypothetical protein
MWKKSDYSIFLKEFQNATDYTEMYTEGGVHASSREMDDVSGVGKTRYKFSGIIPYSTDLVFMTMNSYSDMDERKKWDKQLSDWKLLDTVSSEDLENFVYWENTCWPYYLSNRDWICYGAQYCEKTEKGNQYMTLARKTDHKADPKE